MWFLLVYDALRIFYFVVWTNKNAQASPARFFEINLQNYEDGQTTD